MKIYKSVSNLLFEKTEICKVILFLKCFFNKFLPEFYMLLSVLRLLGMILFVLIIPALILLCLPFDPKRKAYFFFMRLFGKNLVQLAGITLSVEGKEHLNFSQPHIYISNHASMMDIPCVLAGLPQLVGFVYKKELHWIPFFGIALKWGKIHIPIHRQKGVSAMESLDQAANAVKTGQSVLLFAEGTRTKDGNLQPFKRGAFYMAVRAGVPVVPLTINGTFPILPKQSFRILPGKVSLHIGKPIYLNGETGKDAEKKLMDDVRKEIEVHFKQHELNL